MAGEGSNFLFVCTMLASIIQSFKLTLVSTLGLSKDALHIYVGLGVFIIVSLLFKKPLRSWLPWCFVLAAACLGELVDMRDDLNSFGHWRWQASLHDIVNTLFWPTVFFGLARFTQRLAAR